jgi:hypothetical protein
MNPNTSSRLVLLTSLIVLTVLPAKLLPAAEDLNYTELKSANWKATVREVAGLKGKSATAIGFPVQDRSPVIATTAGPQPAGLYRVRITVRPSHVADDIAWHGAMQVQLGEKSQPAELEAKYFTRVHLPEVKTFDLVHDGRGPLEVKIAAVVEAEVVEKSQTRAKLAQSAGPGEKSLTKKPATSSAADDLLDELTVSLSPETHFYYLIDKIEFAPLSHSARVAEVYVNKVRYNPGEMLTGYATLENLSSKPAKGTLTLYLEHGVQEREEVGQFDVTLLEDSQRIPFEVQLPSREMGHALLARFDSADGADHSQAAEYFNIAANFQRVLIAGSPYGQYSSAENDPEAIAAKYRAYRHHYTNMQEVFAWAEEDMVEMSPEADVWYSGQTCYRIHKAGLQEWIRQGHEQGWAWTTYGKFIMSGYLGWKTAWDYPRDHRSQFVFPVGMWESLSVRTLDRFRYKEFVPYTPQLETDGLLNGWWQSFLPINPDPTPRMARIAAEEVIRSADMFGWDAVRWDGQMRSGGQVNVQGKYDYDAARRTQSLVRYFKDIVATRYPNFRHGYNYLFTSDKPSYDWVYEDFEMDELCEGGGLIMNESIRNGTNVPFTWHAANIQVEGDLCRERGGYYLCIPTDATSPRDKFVEMILYYAGGARPYVAPVSILNRYGTRYSQYTLDETLRRIVEPEAILKPTAETTLWWNPFVYETQVQPEHAPPQGVRRQLVVNLMNVPRNDKLHASTQGPIAASEALRMSPGSEPVRFQLSLPAGHKAVEARLIDPFTLEVTPAAMKQGQIEIPPIAIWNVLVIDVDAAADVPAIAEKLGPPKTFHVLRPGLKRERYEMVHLDPNAPLAEAEAEYFAIPGSAVAEQTNDDPALAKLSPAERNTELLAKRQLPENQPESYLKQWWKGGALGADLELQEKPPVYESSLRRNGQLDIFFARWAFVHSLRFPEAFARFDRFSLHEALLSGGRVNYGFHNNLAPVSFRDKDLLIYADIPHSGIGVRQSYALVDYVKAGGGIFFTGGNYSFGKGGYMWTVLDRELLPVQAVETVDIRYADKPLPLEAGPDFKELNANIDFAARPVFWVYNQVALRPNAQVKVFLKSGNRPIMVGWELGQGRVVCLLATQMGQSGEGSTAYFDWDRWPELTTAVIQWLAPHANQRTPRVDMPEAELAALHKKLGTGSAEDTVNSLLDDLDSGTGIDLNASSGDSKLAPKELDEKELAARVTDLQTLFAASEAPAANVLAYQLASISNLPPQVVDTILSKLSTQVQSPKTPLDKSTQTALQKAAQACLSHRDAVVKGRGYELLALAGDKSLVGIVEAGLSSELPKANPYRCLAIARYSGPELVSYATDRIVAWSAEAERNKLRYTGGTDWTIALPEQPTLDTQKLLERVALLAYLSKLQPEKYAGDFAKAWLQLAHHIDYCDLTIGSKYASFRDISPAQQTVVRREIAIVADLRADFVRMQSVTRPQLEKLFATVPSAVAVGLGRVKYQVEAQGAIALLGEFPAAQSTETLELLAKSQQPLLAAFCQSRLAEEQHASR